jgi:hypothetical protein
VQEIVKPSSNPGMEQFKYKSCLNSFIKLSSHVGTVTMKVFLPKKKAVVEELGGQSREASWIIIFLLSKACPGAYRSYRMNNVSCFAYLCMCCIVHDM